MANFMDLATELVLAITSLIPRSADRMHLVLVNRKLHNIIVPQLYKHIVLDQKGDPSKRGDFTRKHGQLCWDTARLHHLTSVLKDPALSHKPVIECLDLELDSDTLHESFGCSDIMQYLPSLKSLCLSSKRPAGHSKGPTPYPVSPLVIGRNLRDVRKTLERVAIDIDQDIGFRDGSGIGIMRHFIALKHLSIQSYILFGDHGNPTKSTHIDGDEVLHHRALLARILPPGLQKLQIDCVADEEGKADYPWTQVITFILADLMKWGLEALPELHDITVYYPPRDRSSYLDENFVVEEEVDLNAKCKVYAFKGQWAELGRALMERATREMPKRRVAVRYEQGTPKASRG